MALQGHPRSLILAPIESAYATSYWSSIVTKLGPILPRFRDIAGFLRRATPPHSTRILGVFPLDQIADLQMWDPRSEDPELIIRVINFKLVQPICSRYHNVTDRGRDRQTDDLAVMWCLEALPRLEAASRQNFHCLGLVLGLDPWCLGLGLGLD